MSRINCFGIIVILNLIVAVGCSGTQEKTQPEWDKTITLPSGGSVLDMRGKWDMIVVGYGDYNWINAHSDIITITQEDMTFNVIKLIGKQSINEGLKIIKGELDKNGVKAAYAYMGSKALNGTYYWEECKCLLNEKGDKIDLDCGERIRYSLTRK